MVRVLVRLKSHVESEIVYASVCTCAPGIWERQLETSTSIPSDKVLRCIANVATAALAVKEPCGASRERWLSLTHCVASEPEPTGGELAFGMFVLCVCFRFPWHGEDWSVLASVFLSVWI